MAVVTGLGAFYFFFVSLIGIFKFLKWKNGIRGIGTAVRCSGPNTVYSPGSGKLDEYVYEIKIENVQSAMPFKYIERISQKDEHKLRLNEPVEIVYKLTSASTVTDSDFHVILAGNYDRLKKNLYMNPVYCAVCIALTVILIIVGAFLSM